MKDSSLPPQQIFPDSKYEEIWIIGNETSQSNVLVTVSNKHGEKTALISGDKIVESQAKLFVVAPPERLITGTKVWYVRATTYLQLFCYVFSAVLMTFSALSVSGVVKARIVLTGSMTPTISPGDIIVTVPPTRMTPEKGDVVAYEGKRFDGTKVGVFSHRIIGGDAQNGFIVKGDANPSPDVQRPKIPDITGIVIFTIPFIGKILTPRSLIVLVPLIFGFWLVMDALKNEK